MRRRRTIFLICFSLLGGRNSLKKIPKKR